MAEELVTGNVYNKYHSRNPIARKLVRGFLQQLRTCVESLTSVRSILSVGCGEGYLAHFVSELSPGINVWAVDIDAGIIAQARAMFPTVNFLVADICALPWKDDSFDLVIAAEVLEHLRHPDNALAELARVTRQHLLASVPNEPLWRFLNCLRGSYIGALGNTPGHVQHWNAANFKDFIGTQFTVASLTTPLPWIMVVGEKNTQ